MPGDLVVGDADGVIVVPQRIEERTLARAFEMIRGEDSTRDELIAGNLLKDVFARHGIL